MDKLQILKFSAGAEAQAAVPYKRYGPKLQLLKFFGCGEALVVWPIVSSNSPTVAETSPDVTFTITRSGADLDTTSVVNYATSDGTATAEQDYTAASGTLTFLPGETTKTVVVTILDDATVEEPETFNLVLSVSVNCTLGANGVCTITSEDVLTYAITPAASIFNEGASLNFTVDTTSVPDSTILYWTVLDISTDGAADLTPINGPVVITGNTGVFAVSAITDHLTEGSEGFQVELRTDSIAGTIVVTSILITIADSSITISYAITPASSVVSEGSNLAVSVGTTGIADSTTLFWTILHGTTSNADFSSVSGSAIITSNTGSFNIGITYDGLADLNETFQVQLRTVSTSGTIVATSPAITVADLRTSNSYQPTDSVLVGNKLYISTYATNLVMVLNLDTFAVSLLPALGFTADAGAMWINSITSDGTYLYCQCVGNFTCYVIALTGTAVTSFTTINHVNNSISLRYIDGSLYCASAKNSGVGLARYSTTGTLLQSATPANNFRGRVKKADGYYWCINSSVSNNLFKFNNDLTGMTTFTVTSMVGLTTADTYTTDGTYLYFIIDTAGVRSIRKVNSSGATIANFTTSAAIPAQGTAFVAAFIMSLPNNKLLLVSVTGSYKVISSVDGSLISSNASLILAALGVEHYYGSLAFIRENATIRFAPL
jgi:hypothetical protein